MDGGPSHPVESPGTAKPCTQEVSTLAPEPTASRSRRPSAVTRLVGLINASQKAHSTSVGLYEFHKARNQPLIKADPTM